MVASRGFGSKRTKPAIRKHAATSEKLDQTIGRTQAISYLKRAISRTPSFPA